VYTVKNIYLEQVFLNNMKVSEKYTERENAGENNVDPISHAKGFIRHEFMPVKLNVNGKFYNKGIKILFARVHGVRPDFQEGGS
jgi:hypothetical protein